MFNQHPKKFNILLIGDDGIDEYQYGSITRISPEAPVPVFTHKYTEVRPGMAGNVRENLIELNCNVNAWLSEPSKKIRLIDIKSKQHIIRIDCDNISSPVHSDSLKYKISHVDAIVISDYNKGFISYEVVEWIRKNYSGPMFIDTKKTDLARFNGCYVKINETEHANAKSLPSEPIVTLGNRGVEYKNQRYVAPVVEVGDVTGAGDTFLAALVKGYLTNGHNIEKAIKFAIKASAITVQHVGVYAPRLDEIK